MRNNAASRGKLVFVGERACRCVTGRQGARDAGDADAVMIASNAGTGPLPRTSLAA